MPVSLVDTLAHPKFGGCQQCLEQDENQTNALFLYPLPLQEQVQPAQRCVLTVDLRAFRKKVINSSAVRIEMTNSITT